MAPASAYGFCREGTSVQVAAVPSPGWEFVRWLRSVPTRQPNTTIAINQPTHVQAVFSQTSEVRPGEPVSVSLPSTNYTFLVYDGESGFRVQPPPDATEIRIG